jgi:hypothetical protein
MGEDGFSGLPLRSSKRLETIEGTLSKVETEIDDFCCIIYINRNQLDSYSKLD